MSSNRYQPSLFQGAPYTKALVLGVVAGHVILEKGQLKGTDWINLNLHSLLTKHEFYRLFIYTLTFRTIGEVVFGIMALIQLSRRFEREFGTRGYISFLGKTCLFATALQIGGLRQKPFSCGPYPILGSLLYLFHTKAPRLHPNFISFLGLEFSEKSLLYILMFQLAFSHGYYSAIPLLSGYAAGFISVSRMSPFSRWNPDIPRPLYEIGLSIGRATGLSDLSIVPSFIAANSHDVRDGTFRRRSDRATVNHTNQSTTPIPNPQYDQMPPMTPPSEENINQLLAMGFDREAVVRALTETDNNLEHAANRLLSGT